MSLTLTVNVELPVAVGVPVINPVELFIVRPAGSVPPITTQGNGPIPSLTVSPLLYGAVSSPPASVPLNVGRATIVIVPDRVVVTLFASVIWMVIG